MTSTRTLSRVSCLLTLGVLLAVPSMAQPPVVRGTDLFETSQTGGTVVDFSSNPLPAGFFCSGSAPFTGSVNLKGVPLATSPVGVAANADTVVERLADAVFSGGVASVPVVVRALRLTSTGTIGVFCPDEGKDTEWRVDTCLCNGLQPTTTLQLKVDQTCGCGHANGMLRLNACLRFTRVDTGQAVGPVSQAIALNLNNMPWCPTPGRGETVVTQPFGVDTNCDGKPDLQIPATSNFHPGWSCGSLAVDCWTQYAALTHCHPNYTNPGAHEHCVNPVCGRQ